MLEIPMRIRANPFCGSPFIEEIPPTRTMSIKKSAPMKDGRINLCISWAEKFFRGGALAFIGLQTH
jgi:hypothetical protein